MLTALRAQVQSVLYRVPAKRKPALRRSDAPDALLATDLPLAADHASVDAFVNGLLRLGWRVSRRNDWLLLDAPVPVPAYTVPETLIGSCGCCISLLLRHTENAPADDLIRAVVKAADAGRLPFERLCTQLHGDFAARLRRHEALPGTLLPYLCHACETLYN